MNRFCISFESLQSVHLNNSIAAAFERKTIGRGKLCDQLSKSLQTTFSFFSSLFGKKKNEHNRSSCGCDELIFGNIVGELCLTNRWWTATDFTRLKNAILMSDVWFSFHDSSRRETSVFECIKQLKMAFNIIRRKKFLNSSLKFVESSHYSRRRRGDQFKLHFCLFSVPSPLVFFTSEKTLSHSK